MAAYHGQGAFKETRAGRTAAGRASRCSGRSRANAPRLGRRRAGGPPIVRRGLLQLQLPGAQLVRRRAGDLAGAGARPRRRVGHPLARAGRRPGVRACRAAPALGLGGSWRGGRRAGSGDHRALASSTRSASRRTRPARSPPRTWATCSRGAVALRGPRRLAEGRLPPTSAREPRGFAALASGGIGVLAAAVGGAWWLRRRRLRGAGGRRERAAIYLLPRASATSPATCRPRRSPCWRRWPWPSPPAGCCRGCRAGHVRARAGRC